MGPERPRGGFKRLVDDLYYGEVSGHAPIDNAAPETGIQFSPKVLEKYLRKLYGGDFDVSTDIEPSAWREVLRILNDAVATGISQSDAAPTLEQDFYDRLRHSNEVFSAFKVHSMGKRMAALLTDESGQLKPFHKWRDEVMPIASHYVGPWLRTEYNTAVNRAHDAADWKQFERNSDIMPNLRWMPTTSAEPDAEHRIFWKMKLTRPIDDPFWNKHRPGDHWNCKCTLEQTDEPVTDIPAGADDETPQPGLKGNPAKTGQIFDRSHPYFPKSCKGCTFAKGFKNKLKGFFNAEGDCNNCATFNKHLLHKLTPQEKHAIYQKPIKEQFEIVDGNIKRHILKSVDAEDYKQVLGVAKVFSSHAKEISIMPEIHKSEIEIRKKLGLPEKSNPDLKITLNDNSWIWVDVKSPQVKRKIIKNANDASEQSAIACILDDFIEIQNHESLAKKIFKEENYKQAEVYFKVKGEIYKYNSQGLVEVLG